MRIVLTKKGEDCIQELEDENKYNNNQNENNAKSVDKIANQNLPKIQDIYNKSTYSSSVLKINMKSNSILGRNKNKKSIRSKSVLSKQSMDEFFNRDESKVNKLELSQAKKIILKKPKTNISQTFLEKYDDLDNTFKGKLRELTNSLKSSIEKKNEKTESQIILNPQGKGNFNSTKNTYFYGQGEGASLFESSNGLMQNRFHKKHITLGEIISKNNYLRLKHEIQKDNIGLDDARLPLDSNNLKSYNFRSKYEDKIGTAKDLDNILALPINAGRTNLIKYLKQERKISPYYFRGLAKYDESQMYKLNKICQIIYHKKEDEKKEVNMKIQKKINQEKAVKVKTSKNFKLVSNLMTKSYSILDEYTNYRENNRNKIVKGYQEEVSRIKNKYWDKYNVDNLLTNKYKHLNPINVLHNQKNLNLENKEVINFENKYHNFHKNLIKGSQSTPNMIKLKQ